MPTALVTGASSGIGRAFVQRLAASGHDVVLVARDEQRLHAVADEVCAAYAVVAEVLPADLADRAATAAVEARLSEAARPVDLLVNAAGFSIHQPFVGGRLDAEERLVEVMVLAVLRLTHAALPGMVERGHGSVVTVSSLAGWFPAGTYSAAKAWATTFTEGLAADLDGAGVRAMALCPGYTRTEFHRRAGIDASAVPAALWLDAGKVVDVALRDLRSGRTLSTPGAVATAMAPAVRLAPRSLLRRVASHRPGARR